jgi:rRNA maturation endonuclease Nob1
MDDMRVIANIMPTIKENFMTKDEALRMAIDLLELYNNHIYRTGNGIDVIKACKQALEQPAQRNFCERCGKRASKDLNHIHTCTPPQALKEKNYANNT